MYSSSVSKVLQSTPVMSTALHTIVGMIDGASEADREFLVPR